MQAALPMGNNKITGLATPTISTDGVTKAYADSLGPAAFVVTGTGTADVITGVFTPTITALTNGLTVEVRATAANATTTPTFQADATAAKTIVKGAGIALVAGNIAGAGFWMNLTYDSVLDKWVLNNPFVTISIIVEPQGYLTPSAGVPIIPGDVTAATGVFYTRFKGNQINIYDGTSSVLTPFSELTLVFSSNHLASNIYDCFVINDAGTIRLVTGPAWNNASPGTCARGTGAGTTELARLNGLWTNANSMTGRYGAVTTTVAVNQGTYVGSIFIDVVAGQVTCQRSWGKDRKWGVWNAYNRSNIFMQEGDTTSPSSSTTYPTFSAYNADATNRITLFTGLAEEQVSCTINLQGQQGAINRSFYAAIGLNSTTSATGTVGKVQGIGSDMRNTITGSAFILPGLGINVIQQLIASDGVTVSYAGTQPFNMMTAAYRG